MINIGVDQSSSDSDIYEHICLENIDMLYKYADKCNCQHQYKAIFDGTVFSTRSNLARARARGAGPPRTVEHCYLPH